MFAAVTPLLLLIAFLLLLLISLSAPVIDSIYLFKLAVDVRSRLFSSGTNASVMFGVWGYCISEIDTSIVGFDHSSDAQCSSTRLGYTFDDTIARVLRVQNLLDSISHATTGALILHPITTGITFIAFLASLFIILRRGSPGIAGIPAIFACAISSLAALLTTIVFLLDVIFVAVVRSRVRDVSEGSLTLAWGNAVWMALGAAIALLLATFMTCYGFFSHRRQAKRAKY